MKNAYKKGIWATFIVAVILNIALWILVQFTFPKDVPVAVLHYSVGFGIDVIGEGGQIMTLPILGLILLIANTVIAGIVKRASAVAFWMFWMTSPIIQLILIASYTVIYRINM